MGSLGGQFQCLSLLYSWSSPEGVDQVLVEEFGISLGAADSHVCLLLAVGLDLPAWVAVLRVSLEHAEDFAARVGLGAGAASLLLLCLTFLRLSF